MRVATEHVWLPGDSVLLSSPESGFRTKPASFIVSG